jgi:hypothetical protein
MHMNRLLLAGLLVAGWAAAGIGQTAPPTPMPPVGAGVQGTITTQPATGTGAATTTGMMPVPGTTVYPGRPGMMVYPGGVLQGGSVYAPSMVGGGMMQAANTGAISGVVTGTCGLTPGATPVTTTADSGRRRLFRR